jgi:uncharacterized coiled-coil protein SlyX
MLENQKDDYEGSYGEKIENYYSKNREALKQGGYNPAKLTQELFKKGRRVSEGDTYETWLQRNKLDKFVSNVTQREQEERQAKLDDQERTKNLAERGDFMRGVHSGTDQLQATVGGGVLMGLGKLASYAGGDNVVSKYLTGKGFDVYQEQMRQASLNPTKSLLSEEEGKWVNEDLKSIGDYGDAIAGTLGNLVPSMAVSLLSGGVGGKMMEYVGRKSVDKAVGYFVKNQAERMLNKGMFGKIAEDATTAAIGTGVAREAALVLGEEAARKTAQVAAQKYVGSRVGTILGTSVLESTGGFADAVDHMRQKFLDEGMSPEAALLKATDEASATFAMSAGLAAGMVEIFGGNIRLLDMILGDMGGKTAKQLVAAASHARANPGLRGKALNMMRDIMVEAAKQAPAEFGQEAIQEILSMSNINFADPDFEMVSQENFKAVLGAGLAGAIGGMGGGMATQVGSKAKAAFGTTETPESRAKALEVQIARQEDMLARGLDRSMPGLAKALEENKAEMTVLQQHLGNIKPGVGLSYKEAAAKIASELPSPDNKPFTVKSLRNLIRHGNLQESEKGTVKAESLDAFITSRKTQIDTTSQTPQSSQVVASEAGTQQMSEEPAHLFDGPPPDDNEGNIRFSRATRDFEGPGLGRDRVIEHLTTSGLADVANVFESTEELDEGTREMLKTREAENAPAFWHGGKLHVNAARVQDDDHAADLIAHEIIHPAEEAHVAELAKKLGAEGAYKEWNRTLDHVFSSYGKEIESLAKDRGYEKDYDLSTDAGRRGIAGELLADKNIKGGEKFYDRAVSALKKIVNAVRRAMGLKEMNLGESEVRVLLSKMKRSYQKQQGMNEIATSVRTALEKQKFRFVRDLSATEENVLMRVAAKNLRAGKDFSEDASDAMSYMLVRELGLPERNHQFRNQVKAMTKRWLETGKLPDQKDGLMAKAGGVLQKIGDTLMGITTDEVLSRRMSKRLSEIRGGKDFSFEPAKGKEALSFQQVYDASPDVEPVFQLARDTGGILTGSMAYMDNTKVYRTPGQPTHDVDLLYPNQEAAVAAEAKFAEAGGTLVYKLQKQGVPVRGLAIPPTGYRIANVEGGVTGKKDDKTISRSYDVVDDEGNIVGSYRYEAKGGKVSEKFEGKAGTMVDIMIDEDAREASPQSYKTADGKDAQIKVSSYEGGFAAKNEILRYKDIDDLALSEPKTRPAADKVAGQKTVTETRFARGDIGEFNVADIDTSMRISEQRDQLYYAMAGLKETRDHLRDQTKRFTKNIRALKGISISSIEEFLGEGAEGQIKEIKKKFGAGILSDEAKFDLDQVAMVLTEKMPELGIEGDHEALFDLLSDKIMSQNEIERQYQRALDPFRLHEKRLHPAKGDLAGKTALAAAISAEGRAKKESENPAPASAPVVAAKPVSAPVAAPTAKPASVLKSTPKTLPRMPMNKKHDGAGYRMRPDLLNRKNPITTTIQAIWEGFRTATTRTVMQVVDQLKLDIKKPRAKITIDDLKQAIGRQFYVEEDGKRVVLKVTGIVPVNEMTAEEWSQKEGWAPEQHAKFIGEGRERMQGLKEVSRTEVTREVPNVETVELEDGDTTLLPDGTSETKKVERETPLPMEYVQIRYEVVSKTEVGLPDAGLSTEQQDALRPATPPSIAAMVEGTQEYTDAMKAEDDAAVAKDEAAAKEASKEAPGVIHDKNKTATATKPAPLEKPGFAKSDEHLLWLFNQQYRTEPLSERSMRMLRTIYNNIFRKDHLARTAPEWAGFPGADWRFFKHIIPVNNLQWDAEAFDSTLDNFMWLEAGLNALTERQKLAPFEKAFGEFAFVNDFFTRTDSDGQNRMYLQFAEHEKSMRAELAKYKKKQLAAIKKENALNYLAHLLSVEEKKSESKKHAAGLRQGDDPFKGAVDKNGKPIPKPNAINDPMVGKYEKYKAAYEKLAAKVSLEEQALLHAERLSRLRALPMAKKVRLIVSSRPDDFISGIRSGIEYLQDASKTLYGELKEGNLASIYSGDFNKYLSAAWSLLTTKGTSRSESYGKQITEIKDKYEALYDEALSLPTQAERDVELKRLRADKKAELVEARKKSNDEYKALLDGMLSQVRIVAGLVTDKEGKINKALYSAHGKDMDLFVGGLEKDMAEMKSFVDNIANTRSLLQFGTLPYSSDRDVKVPTSLEILQHATVDVRGQIPAQNYGKVDAYIRETVGTIRMEMAKWNALNRLGADTKAVYTDLISRMMGMFAYTGRLDKDSAVRNDIRASQLALTSLLPSAEGTIILEDALRFSAALSGLHEDKKGMSDSARSAMIKDFEAAAILGRTEMTKPSLSGKPAFLTDYKNVGELKQALRSAHKRATDWLASFGVIQGKERMNMLSFPLDAFNEDGSFYSGNLISEDNFKQGLTVVDSAGQGMVTSIVSRLNKKYGASIQIQDGAIFPAFSMTYIDRDGTRQHELEVMREKVKNLVNSRGSKDKNGRPTGQLLGFSVDEIMLGLVGFGQKHGGSFAEDAVIHNLPDALVEKFMAAGFLQAGRKNNEKWSPASTFEKNTHAFHIARELSDRFRPKDSDGSFRTLFGEMEYMTSVRMGTFYESSPGKSLNLSPKDGVFEDMRSFRPGAMLYNGSTGEFVMLGGRAMFKKDNLQRPTGEALYTLVKMSDSKGGVSTYMELENRDPVYYSLADLQKMNVHVVPRTWELLAGLKDSKKGVHISNDFEIGNGLQALADRTAIKEVSNKSGNTNLERAAYSRIITDAKGKQFLIAFDANHHPSIFAVKSADDLTLTIARSPMDVAHDVLANEEFRKLTKSLASAELGSEAKENLFDKAEAMMRQILDQLVAEKKLDGEGRWAVEESVGRRLEDLLYEQGNHEDLRSGTQIEPEVDEKGGLPTEGQKGYKEGDEGTFDDSNANQGISKVGNDTLAKEANESFVETMINLGRTVIKRDAIARSLVMRGPALMQAEEAVHALQDYIESLRASVKSLTAGQNKHEKLLSWHRYVSMERQVLLIERELLPKAIKDLEKAIQNRNFVKDMRSHKDQAAQDFAKSDQRDAKTGEKVLEVGDSQAQREQALAARDAIIAAVLDFELDTTLLSSGYRGYFSALPRSMQQAAHTVFADQKIAEHMNEGRMSKTIRGLFDGGQENLALYILSGMSAMPDLKKQTGDRLNADMARIAYAIMARDIPLPTKKVGDKEASLMKMSELSDADRSLAETLFHLAPNLIAYQREYERAQRDREGWTAEILWLQKGKVNQGQNKTDLALMIKRTGLTRIFKMNDKKLAALAEGRVEHKTDSLDAYELLLSIAKQYIPADLGPGMMGFSLEEKQEFLAKIEVMDVTKKSANFPDQTSLNETEFRQQLDESLVDFVLDNWPQGNEWMQSVAERLKAVVDRAHSPSTTQHSYVDGNGDIVTMPAVTNRAVAPSSVALSELMEMLKEGGLDPELQLVTIAYEGLNMDRDANFNVASLDDIVSFRTQDGLREYSLQTENERLTNAEVYPAFEAETMTGADHAMLEIINVIDPGSYKIKINRQANTGRTPSISVNGIEGGIDFGERTLSAFGHALMAQIQSLHAEALDPRSAMSQARRKHIITATFKALSALTEGERARYSGKFRYRQTGKAYTLDAKHVPAEYTLLEKAQAILSELNVLSGLNIPVIIHGPNVTAKDMLEKADRQVEAFPLDLISLYEVASGNGKMSMQATESLKNLMGFKDRLGRIHVFVGAHANSAGEFDMQEFSKTIYHEAVGHIGLRKVLGAEYDNYMVSVAKRQFGEDKMARVPRDLQIHYAEEFMAHMSEQVVYDAAAGRVVNKNIGTALDRIAAMLARAFRKVMTKLGFDFHITGFEMREVLYYAFEGSKVAGRSGASSFISPSLIPGENLTHPGEFGQYQPNLIDTILFKFADYLRRWEMLNRSVLGSGEVLGPDQDFIAAMRTQKSRIGDLSIMADLLSKQFTDMFKGESFSIHDVSEIAEALHSLERNRLKKHSSRMTNKAARAQLDKHVALGNITRNADGSYGGRAMDAVKHLADVNRTTVEMARDGGMITEAKAEEMLSGYEFYVPIPGRTGLEKYSAEYYALSGNSRFKEPGDNFTGLPMQEDERDVAGLTFAGLRSRIQEISVNRTNNVIYNFAKRLGKGNPDLFHIYLSQAEIEAIMEDQHLEIDGMLEYMDKNGLKLMESAPEGLDRNGLKEWERDKGLIPVYRNGELRYMSIVDKGLAKSFHMLNNPKQVGRIMRFFGVINRWLIKMNTSMNPEFFIPNMVRDIGTALNTLSIKEKVGDIDGREFARSVLSNVPAAMKVIYANNFGKDKSGFSELQKELDAVYGLFGSTGAKIQWAMMETPEQTVSSLDSAIRVAQGKASPKERAAAFRDSVEEFMRKSSDIFENATRLSMFAAGLKAGMSNEAAALLARETTVDFDRKGEWGGALNTLYMFANAGIQGSLTIMRTMKNNPGRAAKHLGAIVGFSFSVAVMNMFMGGDGDDGEPAYFAVNDEIRNGNLIVMLPGFEKGVKIPLPYGYALFWAIGQEMAQSVLGRKSTGAASMGVLGAMMNNFNPLETAASLSDSHGWVRMLSPTLFDPLVDIGFEKTPFGTPLMPEQAYDDQPDSARRWRSVSASSRAVADWVNEVTGGSGATEGAISFSPETLDLLIESTFGGTGKFLSRATGLIAMPFSSKEFTENDVPIGRRFAVSTMQWEDRSKFKSAYDEIHGVNRTMKTLQGNIGMARVPELRAEASKDAAAFRAANQDILAMRVVVNNVYNRVKTIDKQKEQLYKSGLSEKEVQPQLKALNERQKKIYQDFNRRYYEVIDAR